MYLISQYNINGTIFAAILLVLFISDMATVIFDTFGALPKGTRPTKWAFIKEQSDFSTELYIFAKQVAAAAIGKGGQPGQGCDSGSPCRHRYDDRDGPGEIRPEQHTAECHSSCHTVAEWIHGTGMA